MYLVKNVKLFDPQPMGKVDILVTNDRVAAVEPPRRVEDVQRAAAPARAAPARPPASR